MELTDTALRLLSAPSTCYIATVMPDGSPQLTQVWVGTDGTNVVVNTVAGFQKLRNVERDPRVAVTVADPEEPTAYLQIRGRVVETTTEGAREHIDELSRKYTGHEYRPYGGRSDQQRVIVRIAPDRISGTAR